MIALLLAAAVLPGFNRTPSLEPAATFVAGKPVAVYCAKSQRDWHSFMVRTYGSDSGAHGSTPVGGDNVKLDPVVCGEMRRRLAGGVLMSGLAASVETLTHEAIHARGVRDEGEADCGAIHEMPRVAVRFFHVRAGKDLRALMAAAWLWRREGPPAYLAVC